MFKADEDIRTLVTRLNRMVDYGGQHCRRLDSYYHGRQPLHLLPESVRNDCGDRLPQVRCNLSRLAIDAVEQRLDIQGFRLGDEEQGSSQLWKIWESNNLPEYSQQAMLDALIHGRSFLLVWANPDGTPRITVESARQCVVWTMPGNPHRIAGLKRWLHHDGRARCTMFTPEAIYKFQSGSKISLDPFITESQLFSSYGGFSPFEWWDFSQIPATGWELRADPIVNSLGVVPLVELRNRPRLLNWGESELIDALPLVDMVDKLLVDMAIASEYFSTPRRWVSGIELITEVNPDTGAQEVVDPFSRQKGRNWLAENPETRFGMFEGASLSNFTDAIREVVTQFASLMSLPPHYCGLGQQPASADAIRSSEAPLVEKCRRKQRAFSLGWEEIMRLALMIAEGHRRPGIEKLEVAWESPETRGIAAEADAAQKQVAMGVPLSMVAETNLGMSPQQIERIDVAAQASPALVGPPSPEDQRDVRRNGGVPV